MNALLVYPEWPDTYWSFRHALPSQGKRSAYPPLGLLTIARLLPAHWAKRLVDTNVLALTDSDLAWSDVVLVSGMLVQKENLLLILARCRARGVCTVVGGPIAPCSLPPLFLFLDDVPRFSDHPKDHHLDGEDFSRLGDEGSAWPNFRRCPRFDVLGSDRHSPIVDQIRMKGVHKYG